MPRIPVHIAAKPMEYDARFRLKTLCGRFISQRHMEDEGYRRYATCADCNRAKAQR